MQMNAALILGGQQPDFVNILRSSNEAAQQRIGFDRQNQINALYQQQGPGIAAGETEAINALAQFDPQAALGIQDARQTMDLRGQANQRAIAGENRAAEEYARGLSAQQAATEAAQIEAGLKRAMMAQTPEQFDQIVTGLGQPELAGQFDQRDALAAEFMSWADVLKARAGADPTEGAPAGYMWTDPNNRAAGVAQLPGIEQKVPAPYTPEGKLKADLDAGRIGQEEYRAGLQRLAPKGSTLTIDPTTGAITFDQNGGAGTGEPTIGETYDPSEVKNVLTMIDEIDANPNLPRVVGPLVGGGGNNIDDLNVLQRGYYGGDGTALVERIGQLQNTAWLAARDMLKGGGAITDYESRKAEGAVSRLSRAKSETEFRTALKDLRDAITEGEAKLRAVGGQAAPAAPTAQTGGAPQGLAAEDLQYLGLE